jgi:large subunit ribosomal protein L15
MVVRKERKRRRGERSYHGSHKKWRGGGSLGGHGESGMHKQKWSYTVKYEPDHFGKRGFKRPQAVSRKIRAINLEQLDKIAEIESKKKINLSELGYGKLLGGGKITQPLVVEAESFSKTAARKLEEAGGKIVKIEKKVVEKKNEETTSEKKEKVVEKGE